LFGYLGSEGQEVFLFFDWPNNSEAYEFRTGKPPDALGALRIKLDPGFVGTPAARTSKAYGLVCPRAASGYMRKSILAR